MPPSANNSSGHSPARLSVFVARLTWMFLGPVGLIIAVLLIVRLGNGLFTSADALLYLVLAMMLVARWHKLAVGRGLQRV